MGLLPSTLPVATSSAALRHPGRLRAWVLRLVGCLLGTVALVVLAGVILLHSLDRPWLKRRLQVLVRAAAGVEIDYRAVRIDLRSGAEVDGLIVQSPAEVRPFAPDLVRVDRVALRWSPRSILAGRGPVIGRVTVSDVTVTAVVDEHGRTSFDALPHSAPGPTVPLSRRAAKLLATAPPVGQVDVDHVTLELVRTDRGAVVERDELRGVSMTLVTTSAEPTARGWQVGVAFGTPQAPLEVSLQRAGGSARAATARASLSVTANVTSLALTAAVDLRMIDQTFSPRVSADHWLRAEANLSFDPAAGRTEVKLERAEAGDGAATAEASIDVFDAGDPIVQHAQGDIDLARLLRWLPADLVPVTAERARVRYEVDSLVVGPVMRLSAGGAAAVDASLSNVAFATPFGSIHVGRGALSLHAQPAADGGGVAGGGSVTLAAARLVTGNDRLEADDLVLGFDGQQRADGTVAGRVGLRFATVRRGARLVARDGHVELRAQGLHTDSDQPLATRGDLALTTELASLDMRSPGMRAIADHIALHAHTVLDGHPPFAVDLGATAARLRVLGRDGSGLADAPARIEVQARDVQPDPSHPAASRGAVRVAVDLGEMRASLDATKQVDAFDFGLHAMAPSLSAVRPILPSALTDRVPWDRIAVAVRTSGRAEGLAAGDPVISQKTEVDFDRPAFDNVAAKSLSLTVETRGNALHHKANVDMRAMGLTVDGGSPSDDRVALSATVDREHLSLQLQLATEGLATSKLSGRLSFDPLRRALSYDVDARVAGLALLAPFAAKIRGLAPFDLSELEVGLSGRGALLGVVAGIARDGTIRLEPSPAHTAAVEGTADLRVAHFRWSKGDTAIATPALAWHGAMRSLGERRTLDSRLDVGSLHLDLGSRDVDLNGITDEATAAFSGDLADPAVELTQRLSVRAVEQTVAPEYPLGDITFTLSAERGTEGVVHVSDMKIANGSGGTALAVTGNVDLGEGRRTISVTTSLTQDLARLSSIPERFNGRGTMAVEANIVSPDLEHYQLRTAVKAEDVSVSLPRAGVEVDSANGEVPITMALEVGANGVALQRSEKGSPYSMLRFADQHPLLTRSGFFSITRLRTPFVSIAPLVGNLEIEQNVVSLRQFEMGVRGGSITGQCGLDWDGPKSTVEVHVRASGVQSSHGEPFDGNIAVVISAADRTIDGRAEILRIGERHLLDLLDLQDPLHVDPAMNRIRTALRFGYPDSVRLVFDHGFASAHLQLGGLARLVSIGELRGIPMGPIVDKMLAPMLAGFEMKEAE